MWLNPCQIYQRLVVIIIFVTFSSGLSIKLMQIFQVLLLFFYPVGVAVLQRVGLSHFCLSKSLRKSDKNIVKHN